MKTAWLGRGIYLHAEGSDISDRFVPILLAGKAFAGLIDLIKKKKFTKNDNVLFIHTGGAVSLSAYEWAF